MRWLVLLVALFVAVHNIARTNAQEFGTAEFELSIHPSVAVGQVIGKYSDSDDASSQDDLIPCANTYVGFSPIMRKLKRFGPPDWVERVSENPKPKKHHLNVRNDDYFPHALAMRAGDSLLDSEFRKLNGFEKLNGLRFEGLTRNAQFGFSTEEYIFQQAESQPLKVTNDTHRRRLSYVFIMNHSLGGISDSDGRIKLNDLPCDVELPFELQYPWRQRSECRVESDTLDFDESWHFNIVVNPMAQNKHFIKILPALSASR